MTQLEKAHGIPPKTSEEWTANKEHAHKLSVMAMIPEITKILFQMNVAFLCSDGRASFIASDAPAFLFNSALQFQRFPGPGLKQKHVEVNMPLSPEISVCFSWINNLRGYVEVGEGAVQESNRMVFGHSHQYFIANSPKFKRQWFRRLPLDPVFTWRYLKHKATARYQRLRARKHNVPKRRAR